MRAYICQKKYVITFMVSLFIVISNSKQSKTSIHSKMDDPTSQCGENTAYSIHK